MAETFRDLIAPPGGLRRTLRDTYLAGRTLIAPPRQDRFLRCLYSHYVFADQRADFARHIAALKRLGEFVSTADMVAMVRGEVPVDGRYFHLSYDDGLSCLLENAAPVLAEAEVPAIVFVNSAMAADPGGAVRPDWCKATNYDTRIGVLDWAGLAQLQAAGFEIGAHTRHHRQLSEISGDAALLETEIAGCKTEIEAALGTECRYFAWPYGRLGDVDAASIAQVRAAGYDAAFGVYRIPIVAGQTNPFMIPRHHFEPQWPHRQVTWFARGGLEKPIALPDW